MRRFRSQPTRSLPSKPSLVQLRKQAKELLEAYRAGRPEAVAEVARLERSRDRAAFTLADAQRFLARAYGFASWTKLKEQVDGVNVAALAAAVEAGDADTVHKLARRRPDLVNAQGAGGLGEATALHLAILKRDPALTRILIELGADPHAGIWPHRSATTAYTIAKERGYDEITAIIERHDERRRRQSSPPGATISSMTDEVIRAIADDRCDDAIAILRCDPALVGACNVSGKAPLHVAAWKHNPEMVAWLLDHGAPANALAPFTVQPKIPPGTPLDYAALVAGWSAHGRHYTFMENSQKPPAVFHETVRVLRAQGAELTPRAAVAIGDRETILQMHGAGRLHNEIHCLRGGLLSIAVRVNRIEMVTLLLDLGFDPDESIDESGTSWGMPLWFAALCGRYEIAELLLARGADVNAIVFASGDAFCNAVATEDEAMQALLRRHGAYLTVEQLPRGEEGRRAARAILDGSLPASSLNVPIPSATDLAEQMLWAAAPHDPEIVRMCLPHMVRTRDDSWWNYVLINAVLPDSCRIILDHGVDPNVAGSAGYTILHHLATDYVSDEHRLARAEILLDAGASLDRRDPLLRSTPLGWACRWGRRELAELYLARGADPKEPDADPWATPLAWAAKNGHRAIIQLLKSQGAG